MPQTGATPPPRGGGTSSGNQFAIGAVTAASRITLRLPKALHIIVQLSLSFSYWLDRHDAHGKYYNRTRTADIAAAGRSGWPFQLHPKIDANSVRPSFGAMVITPSEPRLQPALQVVASNLAEQEAFLPALIYSPPILPSSLLHCRSTQVATPSRTLVPSPLHVQ